MNSPFLNQVMVSNPVTPSSPFFFTWNNVDKKQAQPSIQSMKTGLLNLFLQHTSAALSLNENWDSDVRADMSDALDGIVKEDKVGFFLFFWWFISFFRLWVGFGRIGTIIFLDKKRK
jgi:hypothetical protein